MPSLAVKIGLNHAIVLQQVHYWLRISTNIQDGYTWVYKSVEDWLKEFPFWSRSTLERIISQLEDKEILIRQIKAEKENKSSPKYRNGRVEHVPEWLRKQKQRNNSPSTEQQNQSMDFEAERKKI